MADYEFTSNGVRYPDITLTDIQAFLELEAQGIATNLWDELRVLVGKHATVQVETQLLYGTRTQDSHSDHYALVRTDTSEIVDELDVAVPLPQTPAQGRELIRRGPAKTYDAAFALGQISGFTRGDV